MDNFNITEREKEYLRDLAKKQLEYSALPIMKERKEKWFQHNDLKGKFPMIHIETWTFENDILPQFKCTSEAAKAIELQIQRNILNHEQIGDDKVVPSTFNIGWNIKFKLFDLEVNKNHSKDSKGRELGHQFIHPITDLSKDLSLLKPSTYSVDRENTFAWKHFVEEIIGDILPVNLSMGSPGISLSQDIVHLMGMETMIYSLVDYPEEFHALMEALSNDHISFLKWKEKEKLLLLNNGNNPVAQGTFGFTQDLPGKSFNPENGVFTQNIWGYMDSQETVSISPDMFSEFFFPYYLKCAKQFGMLNYACCEPVHNIWGKYICKLPNLRKVSISPWCDEEYMGQALKGSNVIYHRKPSPNYLGVGKEFDEDAFSKHILKTIKCSKGCKLEFSFRDIYTLEGNIEKPRRAVQIVRELLENNWE